MSKKRPAAAAWPASPSRKKSLQTRGTARKKNKAQKNKAQKALEAAAESMGQDFQTLSTKR